MFGFGSRKLRRQAKAIQNAAAASVAEQSRDAILVGFKMQVDSRTNCVAISSYWDPGLADEVRPTAAAFAFFGYVTKQAWNFAPEGDSYIEHVAADRIASGLTTVPDVDATHTSEFNAQLHLNLETENLFVQTPSHGDDARAAQFASDLTLNLKDYLIGEGVVGEAALTSGLQEIHSLLDRRDYQTDDLASAFETTVRVVRLLEDKGLVPELLGA